MSAAPWLVKINASEAAAATGRRPGGEVEALEAARALQAGGARLVVVTLRRGRRPGVDEEGVAWRIGPPAEQGAYPVGQR